MFGAGVISQSFIGPITCFVLWPFAHCRGLCTRLSVSFSFAECFLVLALSICVVSGLYAHSSFVRLYEVSLVTTGAISQPFYFSHMLVWWTSSSWLVAGFAPGCCPWLL